MKRLLTAIYGTAVYCLFFCTFLYAIGFATGLVVPKSIDSGTVGSVGSSLLINVLLLSVFAVQHSVMARKPFKRWLMQYISASIERSTYVLASSLALILLFWQWRPMPAVVWEQSDPTLAAALLLLSLFGWMLVLFSTFLINHFELFGLAQVFRHLTGRREAEPKFKTPLLYELVRHPIYLGFLIAFWASPVMSVGHLLFAAMTTGYILVGIMLEERDLVELFGDEYRQYRRRVAMLVPFWRRSV